MSIRRGNKIIAGSTNVNISDFKNLLGNPYDNSNLSVALNDKAKDSDAVHKTENKAETITGVKTFNDNIYILDPKSTADVVPTVESGRDVYFVDKNNVKEGYLEFYHSDSTGNRYIALNVCKDGKSKANIKLGYDSNDSLFATAPTPGIDSDSNEIATTLWVNDKFQLVSKLPEAPIDGVWYAIPE